MENENTIMNATEESIENVVIDSQEVFDKRKLVKGSLITLGVGAAVTVVVLAIKNREKIKVHFTKKKIKDLSDKGYVVMEDYSSDMEDVEVNPEEE